MRIRLLLLLAAVLSGCVSAALAQPGFDPADTSYVMDLLEKGRNVEKKQASAALAAYQKAYAFSKKINYTRGYFDSVRQLAYLLNNLGRHDDARAIAQEAIRKAHQDTSRRNLGLSYFALANTALFAGDFSTAIPTYKKAASYMQAIGSRGNVAVVNQNLGYIYGQQHMYDQAIEYYKRALAYDTTDKDDTRPVATAYFSIANALDGQEKIAESRAYYLKARQYIDPTNDLDFMVNLYSNLGNQYTAEARYDSALYYQREALRMSRELGNPRHELHTLMATAQVYNRMEQYARARTLLRQSYAIANKHKVGLAEFRNIYSEFAVATDGLRDYKATSDWMSKYIDVNDSLNNQQTKELLQDYELKLKQADSREKVARKQRQIDRLEQDRERQNLWVLSAALAAIGIIGVLALAYLYARQRQRTAQNALLATQRERELALMQSALAGQQRERLRIAKEMHDDLGASLTAIGLLSEVAKTRMGTSVTPEVEKISSISADMITGMNEIIWSLNTRNDTLKGLIGYTRAYASEFIDNTSLHLHTDVSEPPTDGAMPGADRRNVFLTVKEALNNVVKHAQATDVTLRIDPRANWLRIEVTDNGRGFVADPHPRLRNGLTNMQSRMAESGGDCEILPTSTGTTVRISYPLPVDNAPQNTPNVV